MIAAEFGWLVAKAGWRPIDAALRLAPGAMLLMALRVSLTGQDWKWVALLLSLSLPTHLADLRRSANRPDDDQRRRA